MRRLKRYFYFIISPLVCIVLYSAYDAKSAPFCSPYALLSDTLKNKIYIGDVTGKQILIYDFEEGQTLGTIALPGKPHQLILEGETLFVSLAETKGKILAIDLKRKKVIKQQKLGHTPTAIIAYQHHIYCCNTYSNSISILNKKTLHLEDELKHHFHFPEQIAIANNKLFVLDALPKQSATNINTAAQIHIVDLSTKKWFHSITLPSGSNALKGACLSPDKRFLYITHIIGRFYIPAKTVKKGWMNTNALSIINTETNELVASVLLDFPMRGSANPWGITCSEDGKQLAIALSGSNEVIEIKRERMHQLIREKKQQFSQEVALEEMVNDLSFLTSVKRRISIPNSKGVRQIINHNKGYLATAYFSADLITIAQGRAKTHSLQENMENLTRKGEMLFHDASYCLQNWQSCASCHLNDGRVDGLNWDLLNDGIGNPKNTKSLLLAHQTPPSMALGVREDATTSIMAGIKHSLFKKNVDEEVAKAIDAYILSLRPSQSPYLKANGKLSAAAKKGKVIFMERNCNNCHSGPYYSNLKSYDLGLGIGMDQDKAFDTPTLKELWRTAPYLYDGRAKSLEEVLTLHQGQHFKAQLSDLEVGWLVIYLNSL